MTERKGSLDDQRAEKAAALEFLREQARVMREIRVKAAELTVRENSAFTVVRGMLWGKNRKGGIKLYSLWQPGWFDHFVLTREVNDEGNGVMTEIICLDEEDQFAYGNNGGYQLIVRRLSGGERAEDGGMLLVGSRPAVTTMGAGLDDGQIFETTPSGELFAYYSSDTCPGGSLPGTMNGLHTLAVLKGIVGYGVPVPWRESGMSMREHVEGVKREGKWSKLEAVFSGEEE